MPEAVIVETGRPGPVTRSSRAAGVQELDVAPVVDAEELPQRRHPRERAAPAGRGRRAARGGAERAAQSRRRSRRAQRPQGRVPGPEPGPGRARSAPVKGLSRLYSNGSRGSRRRLHPRHRGWSGIHQVVNADAEQPNRALSGLGPVEQRQRPRRDVFDVRSAACRLWLRVIGREVRIAHLDRHRAAEQRFPLQPRGAAARHLIDFRADLRQVGQVGENVFSVPDDFGSRSGTTGRSSMPSRQLPQPVATDCRPLRAGRRRRPSGRRAAARFRVPAAAAR